MKDRALLLGLLVVPFLLVAIAYTNQRNSFPTAGWALISMAALVAGFNFFLSWIRPLLYRWRHGSLQGYNFSSGIPMFGTMLVLLACSAAGGNRSIALLSAAILFLDTGGAPCFAISVWRNESHRRKHH